MSAARNCVSGTNRAPHLPHSAPDGVANRTGSPNLSRSCLHSLIVAPHPAVHAVKNPPAAIFAIVHETPRIGETAAATVAEVLTANWFDVHPSEKLSAIVGIDVSLHRRSFLRSPRGSNWPSVPKASSSKSPSSHSLS